MIKKRGVQVVGSRKQKLVQLMFILISSLMILAVVSTIYFAVRYYEVKEQVVAANSSQIIMGMSEEDQKELQQTFTSQGREEVLIELKDKMLEGSTTVDMLRSFFPEELIFVDNGGFHFYPIVDDLAHHTYKQEQFVVDEDGFVDYMEGSEVVSRRGVDLSKYQGEIDWKKVKADGIDFALIRAGIRGYGTGTIVLDDRFHENMEGAIDAGIDVGAYFFTQAISVKESLEEVEAILGELEVYGNDVTMPIVLDVEGIDDPDARTHDVTKEERTEFTIAFLERIKDAGYEPMLYGNMKSFLMMQDMHQLEEYHKWYANYNTKNVYFPYQFEIWQYSDRGTVDGIKEPVDLNVQILK